MINLLESLDIVDLYPIYLVNEQIDHLQHLLKCTSDAAPLESYFQKDLCLKKMFICRVTEMHLKCKNYKSIDAYSLDNEQQKELGSETERNDQKMLDLQKLDYLKSLQVMIMGKNPHAKA